MTQGKGPEADTRFKDETGTLTREMKLLQELNGILHEASQPMTVLLCTLGYGGSLDSMEEIKQTMAISREACKQLRKTVLSMQLQVRKAIEAESAKKRASIGSVTCDARMRHLANTDI